MKGMGIGVVVIFFLIAIIVSFWHEDYTLGNTEYTKWIFLLTGSVTLLMSLATFQKEKFMQHSLMFIPIVFWGILFLVLGIYQFTL
jgi:hypothetical protein